MNVVCALIITVTADTTMTTGTGIMMTMLPASRGVPAQPDPRGRQRQKQTDGGYGKKIIAAQKIEVKQLDDAMAKHMKK